MPLGFGALLGAFTDGNGHVIGAVAIGHFVMLTVPEGAKALQLGVNDYAYVDNSGGFEVAVTYEFTDVEVFVPGTAMPWDSSINPDYVFGHNDGTPPVVVPIPDEFEPGHALFVAYQSGSVHCTIGPTLWAYDGEGDQTPPMPGTISEDGDKFPTFYIPSGDNMTLASIGYQALFLIGDNSSPINYTPISEVKSCKPSLLTVPEIDVTHLQSPNATEEKIPGLVKTGTVELSGNFLADASQLNITTMAQARTIFPFKITSNVQQGAKVYTLVGRGFFSKYDNGPFEPSKAQEFTATITLTGPYTETAV